ncbi:hypothetical protein C5Z26_05180 [Lactobacillus sp. CBA3606]|uniref:hypothetical protein n=1 Tax=Lactobacillus sp. CBA3606 TaxID=2099789 RepID=UPI000CFD5762|nr:hypothetical protein [Lactobacillus sp. CBA3606]AVK63533.1 hypothetical protein C5Z26_05180 [Lactobacillus sp. CBA3606]
MQRNVQTFIDEITAEKIAQPTFSGRYDQLTDQLDAWLTGFLDQVAADQLTQAILTTEHDPAISFRLETSVINLPWNALTEIGKVTMAEDTMPIKLYMIAESEAFQSGLRIDELGTATDVLADRANAKMVLTSWFEAQIDHLNQITEAEA